MCIISGSLEPLHLGIDPPPEECAFESRCLQVGSDKLIYLVQKPRYSREEIGFENLHVFDDPQRGASGVANPATSQDDAHLHRSLSASVRWDMRRSAGETSYPVDVGEGEKGKEDGDGEWSDIHTTRVGVRRRSKSALGQDDTLWIACGPLKNMNPGL